MEINIRACRFRLQILSEFFDREVIEKFPIKMHVVIHLN